MSRTRVWATISPDVIEQFLRGHGMETELRGRYVYALCPFHGESEASFSVDPVTATYRCWGCSAFGSFVELVAYLEDVDELEAMRRIRAAIFVTAPVEEVEERAEVEVPVGERWQRYPQTDWHRLPRAHPVAHYLVGTRRFRLETLASFGVKLNPFSVDYPVIFPIRQSTDLVGYVKRRIDGADHKKYLYNGGFHARTTVAYYCASGWQEKPTLIVEGVLDLMKAAQHGHGRCAALLSWDIKEPQADWLRAQGVYEVVSALDNTPTGREGTLRLAEDFAVKRLEYPGDYVKDVCDLGQHDFWRGMP